MFEEYSNSDSGYSLESHNLANQKLQNAENRQITYKCQQLLTRNLICNNDCLNFNLQKYQNQQIYGRNTKIEPLPLIECKHLIQNIINYRLSQKLILSQKANSRIQKKEQLDFSRFTKKFSNDTLGNRI